MSSSWPGHILVKIDNQLRTTAAGTVNGTAQTRGTALNALISVIAGPDGATAVAGSTALQVQGSNVTATATSNWNNITPDKGSWTVSTGGTVTASGTQQLHLANLQYQYYRLQAVSATTATNNLTVNWSFFPVQDSFDGTTQ